MFTQKPKPKPKVILAENLTEDVLFDACFENELHVAFIKHGNAGKDSFIRNLMAQQDAHNYVFCECHDGKAKATFRIIPVGYVKNLTQVYGAKLRKGYAFNIIFSEWKKKFHPDDKIERSSNEFQKYINNCGFYQSDYLVVMLRFEFLE